MKDSKLTFTSKYANGINTEATLGLAVDVEYDDEIVDFDVTITGKMNKVNENVTVKIPAAKDVVTMEEITG